MMRDLHNNIGPVHMLDPKSISSDTKSSIVDTAGFGSLDVLAIIGAITTPDSNSYLTPVLQESDTTADADFTAVAAANIDGAFTKIDATDEDQTTQHVGYRGTKRYVRLLFDITDGDGGISTALVAAVGILSHASKRPVVGPDPITAT